MNVFPFSPRSEAPARTRADLDARKRSADPSCDITVEKHGHTRRYMLRADGPCRFIGEVWMDQAQHRRHHASGLLHAKMLALQFLRELRDLEADGWTLRRC